ncbi:hypothetical protein AAC387_Pa05g3707 [Persea americana]
MSLSFSLPQKWLLSQAFLSAPEPAKKKSSLSLSLPPSSKSALASSLFHTGCGILMGIQISMYVYIVV